MRAELDWDTDNGCTPDGLEDTNKNGIYEPELNETDPFNAKDDTFIPMPVASFSHSPENPWPNETVAFDASASYSQKGTIVSYEWTFDGNKTTVTEPTINHSFASPGNHTVILKVTDNNTLWNTTTRILLVYYRTDLNRDRKVDILDIFVVAQAFGSEPGDPNWNQTADINNDKVVNILDIFAVAWDFGKTVQHSFRALRFSVNVFGKTRTPQRSSTSVVQS